ncbi:MAG: hypothetical protein ACXVB0_02795 [Mucilaginibacter sp.]
MQRRTFIHLSAFTAIVLTLPLVDGCAASPDKTLELPLFFSHIADQKVIKEAGNAYRKQFPAEDNQTVLTKLLLGHYTPKNNAETQAFLEKQVVLDFKTGKAVTVSGWVLSVTEARQCALFSILNV